MTTPRSRAIVSLAAAAVTLALGACAHAPAAAPGSGAAALQARPVIEFDNEAQLPVHVYLVGPRREWLLGRVAPGARANLRVPAGALDEEAAPGFVRLAVIADATVTGRAAQDPRAALTIAQPTSMLLSQRWRFAQRQLSAPQLLGARADGVHR